jgi:hypothetical protein
MVRIDVSGLKSKERRVIERMSSRDDTCGNVTDAPLHSTKLLTWSQAI